MKQDVRHNLLLTCNAVYLGMLLCHKASRDGGWWTDIKTGFPLVRNRGEMLMLCVTEVSKAFEGFIEATHDDKLPHRTMEEVEMADVLIRAFDYAGGHGLRIPAAIIAMSGMASETEHRFYSEGANGFLDLLETAQRFSYQHICDSYTSQEEHMLHIVSGFSEAMEGVRKPGKTHSNYPDFTVEEIGMARAICQTLAYGYAYGVDIGEALVEKMAYNAKREDHKIENRLKEGGKQC